MSAALLADQAYLQYRQQLLAIQRDWPARIAALQAALVNAYTVMSLLDAYRGILANLDVWSAVPGVKSYAQMVTANAAYDPVAEYAALRAAIATAVGNITSFWPQPGGFCAHESMAADGTRTARVFAGTLPQIQQIANDAQAVMNAIGVTP